MKFWEYTSMTYWASGKIIMQNMKIAQQASETTTSICSQAKLFVHKPRDRTQGKWLQNIGDQWK